MSRSGAAGEGEPLAYRIRVRGQLNPHWSAWFDGMALIPEPNGDTVLAGPVSDQVALHGLLRKVRDLGLLLIAVDPYDPAEEPAQTPDEPLARV